MVEVSGSAADRTNVTGTASLNNAGVRVSFDPAAYVRERYTILNAAGGMMGTFRPEYRHATNHPRSSRH